MAMMTSSDVLKINNSEELVGLIDECIVEFPEIRFFEASPIEKITFNTLAVTGLPTAEFRSTDEERIWSTATLVNKEIKCRYLDASWMLQCAVAEESDWGREFALALQMQTHLKAALKKLAEQTWYGKYGGNDHGFNGLSGIIDAVIDSGQRSMVITANDGDDITDGSSVFAVRTGYDSIQYVWGEEGKLIRSDIYEQKIGDVLKGADYFSQRVGAWVGLQVTSKFAAAKIENLSAAAGKNGLNDDLMYDLIEKFPAGAAPQAFFMSRRSLGQLRKSRTPTNATGTPAPIPNEVGGIPIFVTDAISNNESTGSSSGSSSSS